MASGRHDDPALLIETLGAARDMGRLNAILGVFVRHGFGDSVRRLGLAGSPEKAGHVLLWDHAADLVRLETACRQATEFAGCATRRAHGSREWRQSLAVQSAGRGDRALDVWARQPLPAWDQDLIRERRKAARDQQFALKC